MIQNMGHLVSKVKGETTSWCSDKIFQLRFLSIFLWINATSLLCMRTIKKKLKREIHKLTPIPGGWTDRGHRSQKGCPYSLPFPTRPFLKSYMSHPRWPCPNTLLENSTTEQLPTTASSPPKKHQNLWTHTKLITASWKWKLCYINSC